MTADDIRALIEEWYDSYQRKDLNFFERLLADDIVWTMEGPPQVFPVPNELRGKSDVLAALRQISEALLVMRNVRREVLVDGDRAAIIADRTMVQRATGRTLVYRVASFLRFRDDKLVSYRAFYDTFDMMQQMTDKHLDVPAGYPQ